MSDNKGSGMGQIPGSTGKKRGHQHHVRNSGQRRSNVPADEVIAALRSGSDLPFTQTYHDDDEQSKRHSFIDDDDVIMIDIDNNTNNSITTADINANTRPILSELSTNKSSMANSNKSNNNSSSIVSKSDSVTKTKSRGSRNSDAGTSSIAATSESSKKLVSSSALNDNNNNNLQMDTPKEHLMLNHVGLADSISSESSSTTAIGGSSAPTGSKSKKSKTKREGGSSKKSSKSLTDDSAKKERRTKKIRPPNEERPPLEGAAANELYEPDVGDIENDPEAAEWLKLRCTSERTEVVAEREYRRQNRRCADYPGLAFGRSIFSSDTMMKFNIIRNELHNIMKTQLKRVGCCGCGNKRNEFIEGK